MKNRLLFSLLFSGNYCMGTKSTGHKPGNMENSGNLKNCQNLRENLAKTRGNLNFWRKAWKTQGKCKICAIIANKNLSQQIFSIELLREKFENTLEISGNLVSQNVATLNQDGVPASPYQGKPCPLRFFLCCVKTVWCRKMKLSDLVSSMGQCFIYALISLWRFAQYDHQSLRTEMKLIQSNAFELWP